jgi:hypothetical protein
MTNKPIKEQIRELVKKAGCNYCSVHTCQQRNGHCPNFIPSADLYTMIAKKCKEVVA